MENPFQPWDIWEKARSETVRNASLSAVLAANYKGASKLYSDPDAAAHLKVLGELQQELCELQMKIADEYLRLHDAVAKALSPLSEEHQNTYTSEKPQ